MILLACLPCGEFAAQTGSTRGEAGTGGSGVIKGRIYPGDVGRVRLRLLYTSRGDEITIYADKNGAFTFDGLGPGSYQLTVDAGDQFEVETQRIEMSPSQVNETVMLPIYLVRRAQRTERAGIVSANELTVPPKARKKYEEAQRAATRGDRRHAIALLKEAVRLAPDYQLALAELGSQHLALEEFDEAISALQSACAADAANANALLQLGVAYLGKRQFQEARAALSKAAALDADSVMAHLYTGVAEIGLKDLEAASRSLQHALKLDARAAVLAHYYLGGIYMAWRQNDRAAIELETYLREAEKPRDAERLRKTIAELRTGGTR
jgi:Flp pilus assembly protein TadD